MTSKRKARVLAALAVLAMLTPQAYAETIVWRGDLAGAWQSATQQRRPLLMVFSSASCLFCKKMYRETLTNAAVSQEVNRNFVPVWLDVQQAGQAARQLQIRAFPTTVIVSPRGTVVDRIEGYVPAREFHERLAAAERAAN